MKFASYSWNLSTTHRREKRINPQPQYQRTGVWSNAKNQLLMDSILRGYDIPKIYLTNSSDDNYEHEVIDGQQRLRAIWSFYNDHYALGECSVDLPDGDFAGKKYSELPSEVQDNIDLYELTVKNIENATPEEIRDLFKRLQEGVALTPPEKRNAMIGNMRDFIDDLTSHKVFKIVHKEDTRFMYADWLAHVVCLELANGPTDVKANNLTEMYESNKNFDPASKNARLIKSILNLINDSFEERTPELDIKWGFVDYYLLISLLINEYYIMDHKRGFADFYIGFEQERRCIDDETSLIEAGDHWSKDLYDYIEAFKLSGGLARNIKKRNEVYTKRLFKEITTLKTKDPKRLFDSNQRIVMWRRDDQNCKQCGCHVDLKDMHADHIIPHSKGGETTIDNGQTLCAVCNTKKGNK